MAIEAGLMLLHYRLVEQVGEGGMGVVWKAVDTALDREVAIKILPELFSEQPERLARFEREAKLLASLSHPNIAVIHGLHEAPVADEAGTGSPRTLRFLAMELIPGEDLAERLARGPLPLKDALNAALQLAEGLEAAHEQGVIHRDLKPSNVRLTPDGQLKVLDFGLAKALEADPSGQPNPAMSPTMTSAGTVAGMILGTAAYMSPEQAKGKPVDRRADIFAFGSVLFEMITARQLFKGETVSETLASVLLKDPEWNALPADLQPRVRRLLQRCLAKDPRSRLRDIGDARLAIEEVIRDPDLESDTIARTGPSTAARGFSWWLALPALLLALAAGALATRFLTPGTPPAPLRRFVLDVESADSTALQISPDGRHVVYKSEERLMIRELTRFEPRELVNDPAAIVPFWSPDGEWVAYASGGKIWKVAVSGGEPSLICESPSAFDTDGGGAWTPDGRVVFASGNLALYQAPARGGDARVLVDPDPTTESDFHDLSGLPDGRGFVFVVHRAQTESEEGGSPIDSIAVWADGAKRIVLRHEGQRLTAPVYSSSGHLLYHRSPTNPGIWSVPFDLDSLEVTGEPLLLIPGGSYPSVSADGTLVYMRSTGRRLTQIARLDREGRVDATIGSPLEHWPFPELSPDGTRVALSAGERPDSEIWIHDAVRGTSTRLTFDLGLGPVAWSPDGSRIAYYSGTRADEFAIRTTAVDGSEPPRALGKGLWPAYTPDGKTLIYTHFGANRGGDLVTLDLGEGAEPAPFVVTDHRESWCRISPDGELAVYGSSESGRDEVYLKRFPGGEGKWQVSVNGGFWPRFGRQGDRIYFINGNDLFEVELDSTDGVKLGTPRKLFSREPLGWSLLFDWPPGFDVTAEGEFIVALAVEGEHNVRPIAVVENWSSELATDLGN